MIGSNAPLFSLSQIRKSFGLAQVLKGVDLTLHQGEVLGFLGANGAGKSTLMKIIAGILPPDSGAMSLEGKTHAPSSPTQARNAGISIVHQEFSLVNGLSVVDNLFLGREKHTFGVLDIKAQRQAARDVLKRVGCQLSPDQRVGLLRTGEKQIVEIARSLLGSSKVLILDEPTAALSPGESANLFRIIRELAQQGIGIIYISHRLEEIDLLADRVVVLRDGQMVYNQPKGTFARSSIVSAMAGRETEEEAHQDQIESHKLGAVLLKARSISRKPLISHVSLELRAGELVALTGLIGSGRTELLRLLAGADPIQSGTVTLDSESSSFSGKSLKTSVGFLPEDRKDQGLFLRHPAIWNVSLGVLNRLEKSPSHPGGYQLGSPRFPLSAIPTKAEQSLFRETSNNLKLQPADPDLPSGRFSGGNQQKILLGRVLAAKPRILLLDEPTRGVDVSARRDIYRILREQARLGNAILFATSEFEEAIALGHRIIILREGRIAADIPHRPGLTPEDLMHHAVPEGS